MTTIENLATLADRPRQALLRATLSKNWARPIFQIRAQRLAFQFALAYVLYLPMSLFFPLFILVIGPILYGIPHLFASIRYVPYAVNSSRKTSRQWAYGFLSVIFTSITAYRIFSDYLGWEAQTGLLMPEIISLLLTFFGCVIIFRKNIKTILKGLFFLLPVTYVAWQSPLYIAGILILVHNFVAFLYWISASRTKNEKNVALIATLLFLITSGLMLIGFFDPLYRFIQPAGYLRWADLGYSEIGRQITPWSNDYHVWFHCVVAYAFGQSLHYFVWLKAIGDQHLPHETPTSFVQSWTLLIRDFGRFPAMGMVLVTLFSLGIWATISLPQARILYFAVANYHGFMEIAGLALIPWRRLLIHST